MCGVYAGGQCTWGSSSLAYATDISTFIRRGGVTHDAMANDFQ